MKILANIAGAVLGLAFIAFGLMFLLNLMPSQPPPPEGSPVALFMDALVPTGYLAFVKVLEVLGGIFVALPRFRNLGLLILCPIIVNIIAFHVFLGSSASLLDPPLLIIIVLTLFLLLAERRAFKALICKC